MSSGCTSHGCQWQLGIDVGSPRCREAHGRAGDGDGAKPMPQPCRQRSLRSEGDPLQGIRQRVPRRCGLWAGAGPFDPLRDSAPSPAKTVSGGCIPPPRAGRRYPPRRCAPHYRLVNPPLPKEQAEDAVAKEVLQCVEINLRKRDEPAGPCEHAIGHQGVQVRMEVHQVPIGLDGHDGARHSSRVLARCAEERLQRLGGTLAEFPEEPAVPAEVHPEHLRDGEDVPAMGDWSQGFLGDPHPELEDAFLVAGGAEVPPLVDDGANGKASLENARTASADARIRHNSPGGIRSGSPPRSWPSECASECPPLALRPKSHAHQPPTTE
jgi:hypothetical protein